MKSIVLLGLMLLLTFTSCSDSVTIPKSEYDKLRGVKIPLKRTVTFTEKSTADYHEWTIIKCSDGHDYLENDGGNGFIIMHYIECQKCQKK
jgi:hypothetical protein